MKLGTGSYFGTPNQTRAAAAEVLKINPKFSLERLERIHPYKDIPEKKRYFDALRKAGLK